MEWLIVNAGLVGILFFFALFLGITVWLYNPSRKNSIESLKNIPLREDNNV